MLLDTNATVNLVDIEGELIVPDGSNTVLSATHVVVRGGRFTASVTQGSFTLILRDGAELPLFGQKVLAVTGGGTLTLAGKDFGSSWGARVDPRWPPWAEVAAAPATLGSNGSTVSTAAEARPAAEVALLYRTVTVRGELEEGSDVGAHVMIASGQVTLSNVAFENMGQGGQLGRYAVHAHRLGAGGANVLVESCVVRNSFNRAFAIHDSRGVRLRNNVAFNVQGHAYFIEDGTEEQNTLEGNLALSVLPRYDMLWSDTVPSGFWITNTNNVIRNNTAADVRRGVGFWIEPQLSPFATFGAPNPGTRSLGLITDNTAHSVDEYGAWVNVPDSPPGTLSRFSAYGCRLSGLIGVHLGQTVLSDLSIESGITAAVEVVQSRILVSGIENSTLACVSDGRGIVTPQTDGWTLRNITFRRVL